MDSISRRQMLAVTACRRPPDDNHSLMASVERKPTSASRISEFHPSQNINRQETCNEYRS